MNENGNKGDNEEEKIALEPLAGTSTSMLPRSPRDRNHGILRLDLSKPRRSSGSSVEFRIPSPLPQGCAEPSSPQPSVECLSVTFAEDPPSPGAMDKVRFEADHVPSEAEEEEDYSQSVSAIFQRKASTRRSRSRRRRSSSPMFTPEADDGTSNIRNRRRSSVFTTSSGDTAITVEDPVQEQILQNIKLHKEVLSSVKQQPWNMRRKLRLVRQAQAYIRRHEGELQERLAMSRSTRDVLARFNIVIVKHWQHTKRELANFMNVLIPWEIRIKEIESHFGSVVASYFTFLRWLFWVNLVTALILLFFVAVPEMLMANTKKAGMRKKMLDDEKANATKLFTLWDFDGVLKYSPLFYGYYSHQDPEDKTLAKSIGYKMPLAYFITELVVYIYSFVAILRRMAENSRQSKLSEKDDECVFTWKLFTGWDYMIGNSETAHNRTASIILGFKEALLEEAEKKRDEGRNWKVTSLRIFAHLNVLWLLGSSVYAVILVVDRSTQPEAESGWWRKNEITIVVSLITSLFPVFFEVFGIIERYHPRKKLRMQLARIMALNLLNLYTLIFASFSKINEMSNTLQSMRPNTSIPVSQSPPSAYPVGIKYHSESPSSSWRWETEPTPETRFECRNITVPCQLSQTVSVVTVIVSVISGNTTTSIPLSSSITSELTSLSTMAGPLSSMSNLTTDATGFSEISNSHYFRTSSFNDSTDNFSTENNLNLTTDFYSEEYDISDYSSENSSYQYSDASAFFINGTFENKVFNESELITTETTASDETLTSLSSTSDDSLSSFDFSNNNFTTESTDSDIETYASTDSFSPSESSTPEQFCFERVCEEISIEGQSTAIPNLTTKSTVLPTFTEPEVPQYVDLTSYIDTLDQSTLQKLRPLCWETMFGREMVKLTVMDLVLTVVSTFMVDFFRAVFVRYMNNCWCWDLEKKFPQYGDFKMAENILHLVNNQGMVWMGMFFSPGLPLINIIKLAIMMYLRSWAVLTCNVPHEVVFRASSSNNFYLALLLTMLFLCVLPVGYAVVWVVPSWHCGPFSNYHRIYYIFTQSLKKALPYKSLHKAFDYIASPGIVIPLLMLLVLIIYYLISLTSALREANNDLKIQLRRERTEERRKMFRLVDKKRQEAENPVLRWKKTMPNYSHGKMSIADIPVDILKASAIINGPSKPDPKHKDLIEEIMKKAKRIPSGTSEEENVHPDTGDGTDVEQHESLPYDMTKNQQDLHTHKVTAKKILKNKKGKRDNQKKTHKEKHSSSKDREDSVTSGWSEIPEIRIIQTESAERLDNVESDNMKDDLDITLDDETAESLKVSKKRQKSNKSVDKHGKSNDKKTMTRKKKIPKEMQIRSQNNNQDSVKPKGLKKETKKIKQVNTKGEPVSKNPVVDDDNDTCEAEGSESVKNIDPRYKPKKETQSAREKTSQKSKKSERINYENQKQQSDTSSSENSEENNKIDVLSESDYEDEEDIIENEENSNENTDADNDNDDSEEQLHSEDERNISEDENKSEESTVNSTENMKDVKTKKSTLHKKQSKDKDETENEASDKSSQNTVEHFEMQKMKKENKGKFIDRKNENDKSIHSKNKLEKDPKSSQKAMARMKIAKVLLKEARRRSSSGVDDT